MSWIKIMIKISKQYKFKLNNSLMGIRAERTGIKPSTGRRYKIGYTICFRVHAKCTSGQKVFIMFHSLH